MDVISQMKDLGGAASRTAIVALCGKAPVAAALADRRLVRDARGRYALPEAHKGVRVANSVAGVLSHRSAAAYWGWEQKDDQKLPEVTVPRNRHVTKRQRLVFIPHYVDLHDGEAVGSVTTKRRTLVDCFRNLPYDEALAIADSAVRNGDVTKEELAEIAKATKGRGRRRIICVSDDATEKAANPFESVLRSIANRIPGLCSVAQVPLAIDASRELHPDVGDTALRLALEAESFEFHGEREALARDCERYNLFALLGWLILRFSWAQVMREPAYVHRTLIDITRLARLRPEHADVAAVT